MDSDRRLMQKPPDILLPTQPNILAPPKFDNHVEHVVMEGQSVGDVDSNSVTYRGPIVPLKGRGLDPKAQAELEHSPG